MLKQYELLPSGIVKQKRIKKPIIIDYKKQCDDNSLQIDMLSYLRLGYLFSVVPRPRTLLDVGYANGSFLKAARGYVRKCYGYEIKDYPVPEKVTRVNSITSQEYDVITFYNSLQYFGSLDILSELKTKFIAITVPECHFPKNTEWFIMWPHRKQDEVIHHFSLSALMKEMAGHGYRCIEASHIEDAVMGDLDGDDNYLSTIWQKISHT